MNAVDIFINPFEMHETVCPIEVEVMKDHCNWNANEQVQQSVFIKVIVDVCIASFDRQINAKSNEREYYHCAH